MADRSAAPLDPLARAPSGALVLGGIASVQFGSAVATKLFSTVGPSGAVLLRLAFAGVVLMAIWRPALRRPRRELALAALFGLVLAGMNLSFYGALDRIPLGIAVTLEFVGPLSVAIFGSRRPLDLAWAALAAAGIIALTHGSTHSLSRTGVLLALLAGVLWGMYILVSARVGRAFQQGEGLALAMVVATVAALPLGLASNGDQLFTARSLGLGLAVGMLSSAIPYSLELEALRRIAAHVFGILMSLEPAMAATAGFVVLGQGLSARALVGIGLVIAASLGATRRGRAPVDV